MLEIRLSKDKKRAIPIIVCDQCEKQIDRLSGGIYMWRLTEDYTPDGPLYFFHVGPCNRIYEAEHPGHWAWCSLDMLPKQLLHLWDKKGGA